MISTSLRQELAALRAEHPFNPRRAHRNILTRCSWSQHCSLVLVWLARFEHLAHEQGWKPLLMETLHVLRDRNLSVELTLYQSWSELLYKHFPSHTIDDYWAAEAAQIGRMSLNFSFGTETFVGSHREIMRVPSEISIWSIAEHIATVMGSFAARDRITSFDRRQLARDERQILDAAINAETQWQVERTIEHLVLDTTDGHQTLATITLRHPDDHRASSK